MGMTTTHAAVEPIARRSPEITDRGGPTVTRHVTRVNVDAWLPGVSQGWSARS